MLSRVHIAITGFLVVAVVGGLLTLYVPAFIDALFPGFARYYVIAEAVLILAFGYAAIKLIEGAIISYGAQKERMDERSVARVVAFAGYSVLAILILSVFKVNLTGILIGAGFLGIVLGLASQNTLGNFFAGVTMMAAKPFANGDRVTFSTWQYGMMPPSYAHHAMLPGYSGIIEDIGLMYTKVKLDDGPIMLVPNGVLNQAAIINYSLSEVKDVVIRVELVKKDMPAFKKKAERLVRADKRLHKAIKGGISILVTDIGVSNYGIRVKVTVPISEEAYAIQKLSDILLSVSKDFQT